jgi:hypothetical protein
MWQALGGGGGEMHRGLVGKPEGKNDLGLGRRIILEWLFKNYNAFRGLDLSGSG